VASPNADLDEYRRQYRDREPDVYDVPWCGLCNDSKTRRVLTESSYGEGTILVRCPRCNPHRDVPAGQAPPDKPKHKIQRSYDDSAPDAMSFGNGRRSGDQAYRNSTDPHVYDAYEAGPRR
jgi:hypothetical protein